MLKRQSNPHGTETECEFEYGTTKGALNETVPCPFKPGNRSIGVPENANLTASTKGTTYYFRIHASNDQRASNGEEKHFTTLPTAPHAEHRTGEGSQAHLGDADRQRRRRTARK